MRKILFAISLLLVIAICSCSLSTTSPSSETAPTIVAFTATPQSLSQGESSTLMWNVTNATSIQIDQNVGSGLAAAGTVSISPGSTTTYALTASNSAGTVTSSITVTVSSPSSSSSSSPSTPSTPSQPPLPPNIALFDISPNLIHIPPGPGPYEAVMRWDVKNANNVTIDGQSVAPGGQKVLKPPLGVHNYVLKATNAHGTVTRSQQLKVTQ